MSQETEGMCLIKMKRCKVCGCLLGLFDGNYCEDCLKNQPLGEQFRESLKDIKLNKKMKSKSFHQREMELAEEVNKAINKLH